MFIFIVDFHVLGYAVGLIRCPEEGDREALFGFEKTIPISWCLGGAGHAVLRGKARQGAPFIGDSPNSLTFRKGIFMVLNSRSKTANTTYSHLQIAHFRLGVTFTQYRN